MISIFQLRYKLPVDNYMFKINNGSDTNVLYMFKVSSQDTRTTLSEGFLVTLNIFNQHVSVVSITLNMFLLLTLNM